MKGHKDSDGKFHPHTPYKGVRKSRDQSKKTQGVRFKRTQQASFYQPEPILETELTDIFAEVADMETGEINHHKLDKSVKENIKYILNREKLLGKDESIDIHLVTSRPETSRMEFRETGRGDSGFYQYDFWIYHGHQKTKFAGTAYGDISAGHILDMNLELYRER